MTERSIVRVIGVDPGFASIGLAVVEFIDNDIAHGGPLVRWLDATLVETAPSPARARAYACDDALRRTNEIAGALDRYVQRWSVGLRAICAESFSPPRNASAAAKVAFTWGALVATARRHGVPVLQALPQRVKIDVAGAKNATKDEVAVAVERICDGHAPTLDGIARSKREHVYDAAAVAISCMNSDLLAIARRGSAA